MRFAENIQRRLDQARPRYMGLPTSKAWSSHWNSPRTANGNTATTTRGRISEISQRELDRPSTFNLPCRLFGRQAETRRRRLGRFSGDSPDRCCEQRAPSLSRTREADVEYLVPARTSQRLGGKS